MKQSVFGLVCGLLCLAATAFAQTPQTTLVTSFETPAGVSGVLAVGTQVSATASSVTEGKQALQVDFLPGDWPLAKWLAPAALDWGGAAGLALDVTNPTSAPVACGFTVYDTANAWGSDHSRGGTATIPAGKTCTVLLPFAGAAPAALGLPAALSAGWSGSGAFDLSHVWAFNLYTHAPAAKQTLIVDNVRLVAAPAPPPVTTAVPTTLVTSFETSSDLSRLLTSGTRFAATRSSVTHGQQALQVDFLPGDWPLAKWLAPAALDWGGAAGLALDVTNPTSAPVACGFTVYDTANAWGSDHSRGGAATIPAGKTCTVLLPFAAATPAALGLPAGSLSAGWTGSGAFDLSHIWAFNLYLHGPAAKQTLIVDNVRIFTPATSAPKLVDAFGQNGQQDWPGKLRSPAEFPARLALERAALAAAPARPELDRFGGWRGGPAQSASGFFRAALVGGQWWLVDPDGRLFFSAGVDAVRLDDENDATFTTGREALFAALPSTDVLLARHAGTARSASGSVGSTVNFYGANLERKYGLGFQSAWQQSAVARLRAWGFNTLGNWSDDALCRSQQMPYAVNLTYTGYHARLSVNGPTWAPVDDPYDPLFASDLATSFASGVAAYKNDPYCLGYFIGNEFNWEGYGPNARYGLALATLALNGSASPAKRAFIAQLQAAYPTVGALNAAWNTTFATWDTLQAPWAAPAALTTAMQSDLGAFTLALAQRYFATVAAALRVADPNHLYLGCRFAHYTPEAVQGAAQSCDVVSFNIYAGSLDPTTWGFLNTLGKPALIGEFHFGATDRGMLAPGLVDGGGQSGRAAAYQAYVGSVLALPALVGCHWYEYADEPLTGRTWDGENYGIGLVDVTDTPYPELTQAVQRVNQTIYTQKAAGMSP